MEGILVCLKSELSSEVASILLLQTAHRLHAGANTLYNLTTGGSSRIVSVCKTTAEMLFAC
jgi:hypothetical protein